METIPYMVGRLRIRPEGKEPMHKKSSARKKNLVRLRGQTKENLYGPYLLRKKGEEKLSPGRPRSKKVAREPFIMRGVLPY